jgi:hypothetical protein
MTMLSKKYIEAPRRRMRALVFDRRTKFSYLLLILLVRDFPGDEGYLLLRTRAMVSSHAHPTLNLTLHVIAAF